MVILSGSRGCSPRHHLDYVQRKRSKQHHQHRIGNHQHDMGEQLSTVCRGATEVVERSRSTQSGGISKRKRIKYRLYIQQYRGDRRLLGAVQIAVLIQWWLV